MRVNYMKNRYKLNYFSKYSTLSKRIFLFRVFVCSNLNLNAEYLGVINSHEFDMGNTGN